MIFQPQMIRAILRSDKTQTRRLIKGDKPCPFKVDTTKAVQPGRGKPSQFRIRIVEVRADVLGAVTFEDARAEGFKTTLDFKRGWLGIHDAKWCEGEEDRTDEEAGERFDTRHAARAVWVVRFELDRTEQPRFLMQGSPLTEGGKARLLSPRKIDRRAPNGKPVAQVPADEATGYVSTAARAMPGEPEPLSEADHKRHVQRNADLTHAQWLKLEHAHRSRDLELVAIEERMRRAHVAAQMRNIDLTSEMYLLRTRLSRGSAPEAVLRKLERVEAKAYPKAA